MRNVITINLYTGQHCLMNTDDKTNTIFLEVYGESNCSFEINGVVVASNYYAGCHMLQIPSSHFSQNGKFQIVILRNGLIASTLTFDCTNIDLTSELIVVCTSTNNYRVYTQTKKPTTFPPSPHDHTWESILDKPTTFPPSEHNHDYPQKVLWTGALYMTAAHSITLNEPISKQKHGIALIFSYYSTAAKDEQMSVHFIPKHQTVLYSRRGVAFNLSNIFFNATKYLYLRDTSITGHDNNVATKAVGGVTYDNIKYVLREVIGL